ncbi:hypothetical protein ACJ6WD_32530 [Streptomyces sp. VTCC 41912]|uniref:hypothetical protein n=1 Tax=Streptomyces sp. VTCC 41912 TaxID=3383243 RepID=UPI003896C253
MEENETQPARFYIPSALAKEVVELFLTDERVSYINDPAVDIPYIRPTRISDLDFFLTREAYAAVRIAKGLRSRLHVAAYGMRTATTAEERREAAREFLSALAELIARLIGFLARLLLRLLSGLLGRAARNDLPVWTPIPLERTPEVIPRGPNPAFPVNINWGGHHSSRAPGSAVLAA